MIEMMFRVRVEEQQVGHVLVEAESGALAVQKAKRAYRDGNVAWELKTNSFSAQPNNT